MTFASASDVQTDVFLLRYLGLKLYPTNVLQLGCKVHDYEVIASIARLLPQSSYWVVNTNHHCGLDTSYLPLNTSRVKVLRGQIEAELLRRLSQDVGGFDVIIDTVSNLKSLNRRSDFLFSLLHHDGYYIAAPPACIFSSTNSMDRQQCIDEFHSVAPSTRLSVACCVELCILTMCREGNVCEVSLSNADDAPLRIQSDVSIVTAYYNLRTKSKHAESSYDSWIRNVLPHISTPLVIYTDNSSASYISEVRGVLPYKMYVMDLWGNDFTSFHKSVYITDQLERDVEKAIHHPTLYAIWNSKPWFMLQAVASNPFNSSYFFWVDIGSFRHGHHLQRWPDPGKISVMYSKHRNDTILLGLINHVDQDEIANWSLEQGPYRKVIIEGTFFGGSASALMWW
eukprot:CAMPEP_0202886472 /NCGR_PEP_ID=MMETSP1391-20130828/42178_1 /ASSEMBLY_ACC=CAM_ASM_000867 /TAXON_ID=1034604 /ORGANISM="Chlamydomonas leiostraca, Strain SAG 11-49" /LENGTH=396 /DNA_ID=CAMNT_0049569745 /DNA_START=1927 /DNA_END=3114 /DNA_ORIENTATION=+